MHFTMSARVTAAALAALMACTGVPAQDAPPAMPPPVVPPPPHQVEPDAPLYPDYYALALTHTAVTDDPSWRPLHLDVGAGRPDPAVIVLPVQTQAFGFRPVWNALLGARLDQELQRRHIDASRQTDIVDWRGPFVRRTDDATVTALAAEHPRSALLALYMGHDAADHAFVSLVRTEGSKRSIAHRRINFAKDARDTPERLSAILPTLLSQLAIGDARPAPALPLGEATRCERSDWTLDDLPATASPVATACHALLMGSLLPDYMATLWDVAAPDTPDRLAWLARAWVEASDLAGASPSMRSASRLAAFQLGLEHELQDTSSLADDADVVVRPLARMFWARPRGSTAPQASRNAESDRYVAVAIAGLPDFAAAVVREHGASDQAFRSADLCGMQVTLPYFAIPRGCEAEAEAATRPTRPATRGQRQLLEAWRVAAAWNDLFVEGHMRSSADRLARVEAAIPARIAAHPLIREMRFSVRDTPRAPEDIDTHLALTRRGLEDYVQAIATLQHSNNLVREHPASGLGLLPAERDDPSIFQVIDVFDRLQYVENAERLGEQAWRPAHPQAQLAPFLVEGRFVFGRMAAEQAHGLGSGLGQPEPLRPASSSSPPAPRPTFAGLPGTPLRSRAELEEAVAQSASDFSARLALAIVTLEHGEGVVAARRIVDARPQRSRVEDAIKETDELESSGDLFLFSGEREAARDYYQRASRLDTGSASDMLAKMRVAAIDGDLPESLKLAHAGAVRYQNEWSRANEAGYLFMLGQSASGWSLLLPKMQTATTAGLWRSALVGHRMASTPLADLPDWITKNRLVQASHDGTSYAPGPWLRMYATLDRLPTAADIALLKRHVLDGRSWGAVTGALVIKTAIDGSTPADPDALARDMQSTWRSDRTLFMPFYEWDVWNASHGKDPALDEIRALPLEAGFAPVLAKAMVLAADGRRAEALRFLTAARYELARNGGEGFENEFRTASYDFVLATWLMTRKTGDRAYAAQGLAIARGYQRATESMAWPYAAEALLGQDAKAREIAACRAQWLDPGSMFLHESGLHPDPKGAVCRKAIAW